MEKNYVKKCFIIGGLTVIFWLASMFIMQIVNNRNDLSKSTQMEIANSWSGEQNFVGPIVCVPVFYEKDTITPYKCVYIMPETIEMNADIESKPLHRGIFEASVYNSKITGKGTFNLKQLTNAESMKSKNKNDVYDWENAQIVTAISDKRGLETGIKVNIGGKEADLNQKFYKYGNSGLNDIFYNGYEPISKVVDLSEMAGKESVTFDFTAEMKGSSQINISPIGQATTITMQGNCKDPGFTGFMLPSNREVTDEGFVATWRITSLNKIDSNQIYDTNDKPNLQDVGTKLLIKGGQYTQIDRALKYAFLVILLSLVAVFVAEMCVKSPINLLSYLLIGCALVLFYLMLLSFGEWIGFGGAYVVSAILILGMITIYLKAILHKNKEAIAVCSFMALIDIFIYVLLSIESMSLLVGTLGLFAVLGAAMFFSLRFKLDKNILNH